MRETPVAFDENGTVLEAQLSMTKAFVADGVLDV